MFTTGSGTSRAGVPAAERSADEWTQLVARLHQSLARINVELDLDTVFSRVSATVTDLVDAELGGLLLLDGDHWRPTLVRRGGMAEAGQAVPADPQSWLARFVQGGESRRTFVLDDVDPGVARALRSAYPEATAGVAAAVRAPLHARGVLVAVYGQQQRTPRPAELDVLVLLAEHGAIAITNASAYAEVVRGRQQQHAIVDAIADGVAVVDGDGVVLQWNRSAGALTGIPSEEVVGRPLPFPIAEPGQVLDHRLPDGRWLEILASSVPGGADMVVHLRDVSQARELAEAKDSFLATAGHELRTPVTAIQGFASTLLRRWGDLSDAGRHAAVEVVAERSEALAALVDDMVLGRLAGRGELELAPRPVDLAELLRQVVERVAQSAPEHRIVFQSPDERPPAWGDQGALEQVAVELLDNAVKFSPEGGDVVVWLHRDDAHTGFVVRDHGVGVQGDPDRMFELFYQSGTGDRRRFGGMGLGLYIVRQLVQAQGGWIRARRPDDGGTEVRVTLSRADVAAVARGRTASH